MEYPEGAVELEDMSPDAPRVRCSECGNELLSDPRGGDWIEHHEDGTHTYHPPSSEV